MIPSRQVGLVISSPIRDWPIVRLRKLPELLGPVKASTYRQASRIANILRGGYPVHEWGDLAKARAVLVCVPEQGLERAVAGLLSAEREWGGKIVLIFCAAPGDALLSDLAGHGVACSCVTVLDGLEDLFLVSGETRAIRETKDLVESGGARVLEVRESSQRLARAGASLASSWLIPMLDASLTSFRTAGLAPRQARQLLESIVDRSVRAYLKGGRRAWKPPSSREQRREFVRGLETVCAVNPDLAKFLLDIARASLRRMSRDSSWLDDVILPVKYSVATSST